MKTRSFAIDMRIASGWSRRMSTKAERSRAKTQRDANPPKPKRAPRPRGDDPVDTSKPGVSATDRKAGGKSMAARNASKRVAKGRRRARRERTAKPSRKSTRKASGRAKRTTNLKLRATRETAAPTTRARKAKAAKPASRPKAAKK